MDKKKILVTEDDTVLRDLYLRKFDPAVYDIRTAKNGKEALESIQKDKPDLILLDLNMPVADGFAVLEGLPKDNRGFFVIILTNYDDQANRERCKNYTVDDFYVKKDMSVKVLMEKVETLLQSTPA